MGRAIAALGDSALLIPASLLLLAYLGALGRVRLALAWASSLLAVGAFTLATKLLFHACGERLTDLDVLSPSGHASFATVFYGALALTLAAGRPRRVARALLAGALGLALLVGASRVRTGAHTLEEVVIGLAIGAAGLGLFVLLQRRIGVQPISPLPLTVGLAALLLLLGGTHFSLEGEIGTAARRIASLLDVCGPATALAAPAPSAPP